MEYFLLKYYFIDILLKIEIMSSIKAWLKENIGSRKKILVNFIVYILLKNRNE
jgi:hypothetical protein